MRGANLPAHSVSLPIFLIPVESLVVFRRIAVARAFSLPRADGRKLRKENLHADRHAPPVPMNGRRLGALPLAYPRGQD